MAIGTPNVVVKVTPRGFFKVFVSGVQIAGVSAVRYDSHMGDRGKLTIEVIGPMVTFENVPAQPLDERGDAHRGPVFDNAEDLIADLHRA